MKGVAGMGKGAEASAGHLLRRKVLPGDQVVLVPGEEIPGASLREAVRLAENWVEDL